MNYTPALATTTRTSLREKIAMMIVNTVKPVYFLLRRNRKAWHTTTADIATFASGTLGNDLHQFLLANNIALMPKAEFHDVYHVLFGFGTTMKEETCIQFVPVGNGRRSIPYLITIAVSLVFYPEYWEDFRRAYNTGKSANKFHDWDFEPMLHLPTEEVRKLLFSKV